MGSVPTCIAGLETTAGSSSSPKTEFDEMLARGDRLAMDVIRDGVHLGGRPIPKSMKARGVSTS